MTQIKLAIEKLKRDLLWVLSSPPLLQNSSCIDTCPTTREQEQNTLLMIDNFDEKLMAHMSGLKSHFLGTYYEHLWLFNLTHNERYELVASNYQVIKGGITLGEFDFLVFDNQQRAYVHQELAIKFYLGHYDQKKHLNRWIGPQTIDRLDLKVDKLINHQSKLSATEEGKKALASMGINDLKAQIQVQGYLFYPYKMLDLAPPKYVNPMHGKGVWYHWTEFKSWLSSTCNDSIRWIVLDKLDWIEECSSVLMKRGVSSTELLETLQSFVIAENRPKLLAKLEQPQEDTSQIRKPILTKIFVTPDTWPNKA